MEVDLGSFSFEDDLEKHITDLCFPNGQSNLGDIKTFSILGLYDGDGMDILTSHDLIKTKFEFGIYEKVQFRTLQFADLEVCNECRVAIYSTLSQNCRRTEYKFFKYLYSF